MSLHPPYAHCLIAIIFLLILASGCNRAGDDEYFSWLAVRYADHAVKTFLQGPYNSKAGCEQINQFTWDGVVTACGTCRAEIKLCIRVNELKEVFAKAVRKERAAFPYVIASAKGRIIISGVPTKVAVAECQKLADDLQSNGYRDSRCMLP